MGVGKNARLQIDSETVRALLIVNGGGAVALLALLPSIIDTAVYRPLVYGALIALLSFVIGLLSAVLHSHLRRRCDLAYERAQSNSPNVPLPCQFFGMTFREPCVCEASKFFMWLSISAFGLGGLAVVISGFIALI